MNFNYRSEKDNFEKESKVIKDYIRGQESIVITSDYKAYHIVNSKVITEFRIPNNCCLNTMCFVDSNFFAIGNTLVNMGMCLDYPDCSKSHKRNDIAYFSDRFYNVDDMDFALDVMEHSDDGKVCIYDCLTYLLSCTSVIDKSTYEE